MMIPTIKRMISEKPMITVEIALISRREAELIDVCISIRKCSDAARHQEITDRKVIETDHKREKSSATIAGAMAGA